jgi:hypothetical protein
LKTGIAGYVAGNFEQRGCAWTAANLPTLGAKSAIILKSMLMGAITSEIYSELF